MKMLVLDVNPTDLTELIRFDENSGEYSWRYRSLKWFKRPADQVMWNKRFAGAKLFQSKTSGGYNQIGLLGKIYKAHRIVWAFHHGEWPKGFIDHVNGVRDDNSIANLRVVTSEENAKNASVSSKNKSGYPGVRWDPKMRKWRVQISKNRRRQHLGFYSTLEEAASVRKQAEGNCGYHPNHGRVSA
jgi:hypothetical protein